MMSLIVIPEFANPKLLYLLVLLIPMIIWYILKHKKAHPDLQVSTLEGVIKSGKTKKHILHDILFVVRCIIVALLVFILARPQSENKWQDVTTEGIDIMLALDISGSMLARDFHPDRLEASKEVAMEFIAGRPDDRMGLVVFSAESFTQCPLTTDHSVLINLFKGIKSGMIEDGTAIGLGLATAVNRLKDSKAVSKVIILLTDGVNNMGSIAPITAAEIAKAFNIRVYTIGVGTRGMAPYPVQTFAGTQYQDIPVEIDEEVLTKIAEMTDGKYFRATDNEKLKEIYQRIDQMEKSKIDVKQFSKKQEEYQLYALVAGMLFLIEIILRNTLLHNIP